MLVFPCCAESGHKAAAGPENTCGHDPQHAVARGHRYAPYHAVAGCVLVLALLSGEESWINARTALPRPRAAHVRHWCTPHRCSHTLERLLTHQVGTIKTNNSTERSQRAAAGVSSTPARFTASYIL